MEELRSVFRLDMEGQDELIAKITAIRKAQDELKGTQSTLTAESKAGNIEAAKTLEKNKIQVKEYGKEITALSKQVVDQSKANKTQTGSLTEMRLQLKNMTREYDNLSKEQREGTAAGVGMQKSIKALSDELALAEGGTGRMQRKVGSYQEAVDTTNRSIRDMQMELRALRSIPLDNLNPEQIAMTEQNMGRLTDAIGDANARIQVQAMEDIPALVSSLQGVVAASQLVVGTMGLIGVDSERVERFTQAMVQLMGVSQSLATISELYNSGQAKALALRTKDIIVTNAQAVAIGAVTAAKWMATKATAAWTAVQKVNPILLLAGVIAAVIMGIITLVKNIDKVTAVFRRMGQMLGIVKKETEVVIDTNERLIVSTEKQIAQSKRKQDSLGFEIKLLQALGASNETIIAKQREMLVLQHKEMQMAIEVAKAQRLKGEITAEAFQEAIAAATEANRAIILFDAEQAKAARERQAATSEQNQAQAAERQVAAQKRRQQEEAEQADRIKREAKAAKELAIINATTDEERLGAGIDLIRHNSELELQQLELTESERLLIKAEAFNREQELRNQYDEQRLAAQAVIDKRELEAKTLADEQKALIDQRQYEREQAQLRFEEQVTDARIGMASELVQLTSALEGEQSQMAQALKAIQKGIALVEIGVNLQRELSIIRIAAAAQNAILPGSGVILGNIQSIRAIAQAGIGAAKVLAMNKGGSVPGVGSRDTVPAMLTPGEGVLRKNAMQAGEYWNLSGTPKQIASTLNQAYGGVEFRNRGGIIGSSGEARTALRQAGADAQQQMMVNAFRNIQIITTIEDINNGISGEAIRNRLANYFG